MSLVVGAGSGIGEAVARSFADAGSPVIVVDLNGISRWGHRLRMPAVHGLRSREIPTRLS